MPDIRSSSSVPARKSIRSKMIKRVRDIGNDTLNADNTTEKPGQQVIRDEKIERIKRRQSTAADPLLRDKPNLSTKIGKVQPTRTAPNGRRAMVSDRALESMAAKMEKSTNMAIRKIGRSIGF